MILIDREKLAEEILNILYNYRPLVKLVKNGKIEVPTANFLDFCQDFGFLIAAVLEEHSQFDDKDS